MHSNGKVMIKEQPCVLQCLLGLPGHAVIILMVCLAKQCFLVTGAAEPRNPGNMRHTGASNNSKVAKRSRHLEEPIRSLFLNVVFNKLDYTGMRSSNYKVLLVV